MRQVTNSASSPAAVQRPRRKTRRSFRAPARWLWASRLSVVTSTPGKAYEVAEPRVVPEGGQVNSYDTRAAPGSPPLAGSKLLFRYSPRLDPYWQRITRLVRSVHPGLVRNNQAPLRMGASARRLAVDARRGMAQRQLDGEAAAATRMAGHLDGSPQDQHQLAHHGEAEANPARRAGVGDVDLVETLEDAVELRHGDADAVVLDADSELVALGSGAEYLTAFSSRLPSTWQRQRRSVRIGGRSTGRSKRTRTAAAPSPSTASRQASAMPIQPNSGVSWPPSSLAAVSRLSTRPRSRSAWRSMMSRDSSRLRFPAADGRRRRVLAEPIIAVRGVRTSCEASATNWH